MREKTTLFYPHLYLCQEEYELWGLDISPDFWEKNNIYQEYKNYFQQKLERSIINEYKKTLKEESLGDKIIELLAPYLNDEIQNDEITEQIRKVESKFNSRLENYFEDDLNDVTPLYAYNNYKPQYISELLMNYYHVSISIQHFIERLKIIKQEEDLMEYYLKKSLVGKKDAGETITNSIKENQLGKINQDPGFFVLMDYMVYGW